MRCWLAWRGHWTRSRPTHAPVACKKLRGAENLWRVRVGDYRIVYHIDDRARLIEVRAIRDRKDVYG